MSIKIDHLTNSPFLSLNKSQSTTCNCLPIGSIIMWIGNAVPNNWILCDGTHGTPDLRGRVPVGVGQGAGLSYRTYGDQGGEETHLLTINEMPSHNHTVDLTVTANGYSVLGTFDVAVPGTGVNTLNTGGSTSHNIMQPFTAVNFIMKIA